MVLEVKGGHIRYEAETRQWFSRDFYENVHHIKDPFEQASKSLHTLMATIRKSLQSPAALPFAFGYAVCFPDLVYKGGAVPPGAEPNIIIDLSDFLTSDSLTKAIANALRKWSRSADLHGMTPELRKQVERAISPEFNLVPRLSRQLENQEEQLIRLTDEQLRMLEFCRGNPRVAIEGVAGSGKTLLALEQSRYFASQGKRTLLLCFNKALAEWLREVLPPDYADSIHIHHFHGLAHDACQRAGIVFQPDKSPVFWQETCAELLMQAANLLPDLSYDAVVVDEGQDFFEDWWIAIDELTNNGSQGHLYVFYDPAQTLFTPKESIPEMQFGGRLPTNCRNTQAIAETCSTIIGTEIKCHYESPPGIPIELSFEADDVRRSKLVAKKLADLLQNEGLDPSQVAILAPHRQQKTCLSQLQTVGRLPINDDPKSWRSNKSILMTTIRAFKGLEADVVLLLLDSQPKPQSTFTVADYYVAASRAKHVLHVVSKVNMVNTKLKEVTGEDSDDDLCISELEC